MYQNPNFCTYTMSLILLLSNNNICKKNYNIGYARIDKLIFSDVEMMSDPLTAINRRIPP